MPIRKLHRLNALVLGVFIILHFINHLMGLGGLHKHLLVMDAFRQVYQVPLIEISLFLLFAMQIILGVALVIQRGRPKGKWAWLQVASGLYIAFFLLQHLGTIAFMRITQSAFDTNFYFAASVVLAKPIGWYFTLYYALGVFSVFAHVAAALHFKLKHWAVPSSVLIAGIGMSIAIPMMLSGAFYSIELPIEYKNLLFESYPDWLISFSS